MRSGAVQVDTRVLPHSFTEIDAASRELQSVKLTGTMNYHLEPGRANELYQTVGLDFANKVIDPAFNDFIKEVIPQYPVTEILASREEIRLKARERLGANLALVTSDDRLADVAGKPTRENHPRDVLSRSRMSVTPCANAAGRSRSARPVAAGAPPVRPQRFARCRVPIRHSRRITSLRWLRCSCCCRSRCDRNRAKHAGQTCRTEQ